MYVELYHVPSGFNNIIVLDFCFTSKSYCAACNDLVTALYRTDLSEDGPAVQTSPLAALALVSSHSYKGYQDFVSWNLVTVQMFYLKRLNCSQQWGQFKIYFILCVCMFCLRRCTCTHVMECLWRPEVLNSLELESRMIVSHNCGCWELNPSSLEEQSMCS